MTKIDVPYHTKNKILSPFLPSLLSGLLEKDPNKRLSMTQFFQHNFIQSEIKLNDRSSSRKINDYPYITENSYNHYYDSSSDDDYWDWVHK